jgi:hypothetical protein
MRSMHAVIVISLSALVLMVSLPASSAIDAPLFPVIAPADVAFNYPEPPQEGAANFITLTQNGQACCVIVLPATANPEERFAAEMLKMYLTLVSGATVPLLAETEHPTAAITGIYLGATKAAARVPLDLPPVRYGDDVLPNVNGFLVCTPDAQTLIIHGATPRATTLGVVRFLKRYLGVRRFWPGKPGGIGDVIPKQPTLRIPELTWRDWPYCYSRELDGSARTDPADRTAARWRPNRPLDFLSMAAPLSTHHGYATWLPPARYGVDHPEYYPLRNGKRDVPQLITSGPHTGDYDPYWQPCVSNPDVVRIMADGIIAHFRAHPEAISVSLAVNDGLGDCQCDRCRAMDAPGAEPLTRTGFCDRYVKFDNAVCEQVAKVFPDKILTVLGYGAMRYPPTTVALHPMLLPVPTINKRLSTFTQWDAWMRTGAHRMGVYLYHDDQISAILPKMDVHQSALRIRYLVASGRLRHFFQEFDSLYPLDGMIPHLEGELLWDPRQNPDAILDEYYSGLFGPAAAPMRDFYAALESGYTRWLAKAGIPHPAGKDIGNTTNGDCFAQFELLTRAEAERAATCLQKAAVLAKDDPLVTQRIAAVRPLFEFAALGAHVYGDMEVLRAARVASNADAQRVWAMVRGLQETWSAWGAYRRDVMQKAPATDYARHFRFGITDNRNSFVEEVQPDTQHPAVNQAVCAGVSAIADGLRATVGVEPALAWLRAQQEQATDPLLITALAMAIERVRGVQLVNLVKDPGFEQLGKPMSLDKVRLAGASATARRRDHDPCRLTDQEAHAGRFSVVITNSLQGGLSSRRLGCGEGECYHLSLWVKHNAVPADYRMEIQTEIAGGDGPVVQVPIPTHPGVWQEVSTDFIVPSHVTRLTFGLHIEQQGPGATIWCDELFVGKYPVETLAAPDIPPAP